MQGFSPKNARTVRRILSQSNDFTLFADKILLGGDSGSAVRCINFKTGHIIRLHKPHPEGNLRPSGSAEVPSPVLKQYLIKFIVNEQLGWQGVCVEPEKNTFIEFSYMETTTVDTLTFNDMMNDFPNIKHIDFLSIDTEGHEMNVLQWINFDKYYFGLITIETKEGSDVVKFVEEKGYKLLMTAGSDVVFTGR